MGGARAIDRLCMWVRFWLFIYLFTGPSLMQVGFLVEEDRGVGGGNTAQSTGCVCR